MMSVNKEVFSSRYTTLLSEYAESLEEAPLAIGVYTSLLWFLVPKIMHFREVK